MEDRRQGLVFGVFLLKYTSPENIANTIPRPLFPYKNIIKLTYNANITNPSLSVGSKCNNFLISIFSININKYKIQYN